ncbi:PTS sugar transporter subunit IIA [Dolosicoccus paucivorans]|uniref:PTS sugar transporter subunit IIA n=1 Tax=Dolosicoccus paucivorans TaxID=84521 RepID=A0A2N6SPH8_9LACT|nr:PTS sugar transporter subunit IIA [Dolosicoccus paucivorans]PMC58971.1 PTS sugar transporter subunit IIA [Dolosicoccus paucivorans]
MYLNKNLGILHIETDNRNEIIERMVTILEENEFVHPSYRKAILEREEEYPTGLEINGIGFAIPHTDSIHVNKSQICYVTAERPIKFKNMADPSSLVDVQLIFMLAMKEAHEQLEMLQNLMDLFQDKEKVEYLLSLEDKEKFKETLVALGVN